MKVLLVGDYPPPFGGIAVHIQQLRDFFHDCGADVQVLDIGKGAASDEADVLSVRSGAACLKHLQRFAARGYRIHLHTNGHNAKSWMLAAAVAAMGSRGPRPVVTLHSGLLPRYLAGGRSRRWMARSVLARFGRAIAVSPQQRLALGAAGVPDARLRVCPAFLASRTRPGEPPAGLEEAVARRRPLLAMAHHPDPLYGRALMFEALRLLEETFPSIGLALYGPGTEGAELQAEATSAGVVHRLERFGELLHPQALALLSRCQLFVRPTTADGDAISVREALTLRVPCVASDVAPRPEGTVLFQSGNARDLADKVKLALFKRLSPGEPVDAGVFLLSIYRELEESETTQPTGAVVGA